MSAKKGDVIIFSASTQEENPEELKQEFETTLAKGYREPVSKIVLPMRHSNSLYEKAKRLKLLPVFHGLDHGA